MRSAMHLLVAFCNTPLKPMRPTADNSIIGEVSSRAANEYEEEEVQTLPAIPPWSAEDMCVMYAESAADGEMPNIVTSSRLTASGGLFLIKRIMSNMRSGLVACGDRLYETDRSPLESMLTEKKAESRSSRAAASCCIDGI